MRSFWVLIIVAIALNSIASRSSFQHDGGSAVANLLTEIDPPAGFTYALAPRKFDFPADHASHPGFRTEWWYFTGNTSSADGHEFGFQLTLFRFAMTPHHSPSRSPWRRNSVYLGHFAISDITTREFHSFERQSRPALDLAGAHGAPVKMWIKDWSMELVDAASGSWRLKAHEAGFSIDLALRAQRPVTLQGENGLSTKNSIPGNASYYYSITRLSATGTIATPDAAHDVRGAAWYDHEWSTSALAVGQTGWDWFSLQLSDSSEIMFYKIRDRTGRSDAASHGVIVAADGHKTTLSASDIQFTTKGYWRSPLSGVRYPAAWQVHIPKDNITLSIRPRFSDQEWRKNFTYWEGAVAVTGAVDGVDVSGKGYVELVGYD